MLKTLTKEEVLALFASEHKSHFVKSGRFIARTALEGETVLTILNGKLETIREAEKGDIVIRNIEVGGSAESYIISGETFERRYDTDYAPSFLIDNRTWFNAVPKGEVMAFQYFGEAFTFTAPWGQNMLCNYGDWIANPVGGDEKDVYRIEEKTFEQTYTVKKPLRPVHL